MEITVWSLTSVVKDDPALLTCRIALEKNDAWESSTVDASARTNYLFSVFLKNEPG